MSWFKNLDYEKTWDKLRKALTSRSADNRKNQKPARRVKISILLIALRNGCRLSEAIAAYNGFVNDQKRKQEVRVMKRGFAYKRDANGVRRRASNSKLPENPVYRTCIIPDEVDEALPPYRGKRAGMGNFAIRNFGFNPHALRYCFITAMGKKGVAPQVISKMTGHASLTEIIRYTEQQAADDILEMGVL